MFFSYRPCSEYQHRRSLSLLILAALILECLGTEAKKDAQFLADSAEYSDSAHTDERFEEDGFIRYIPLGSLRSVHSL
jgi:hypothetical protein